MLRTFLFRDEPVDRFLDDAHLQESPIPLAILDKTSPPIMCTAITKP
jgi:hypothetical protein